MSVRLCLLWSSVASQLCATSATAEHWRLQGGQDQGGSGRRLQATPMNIRQVQNNLAGLGYMAFQDVTGVVDARTTANLKRFQADHCLPQTGFVPADAGRAVDVGTETAMRGVVMVGQHAMNTRVPAQSLVIDGLFGPLTMAKLAGIQKSVGPFFKPALNTEGVLDDDTAVHLSVARRVEGCPCSAPPPAGDPPQDTPPAQPEDVGV